MSRPVNIFAARCFTQAQNVVWNQCSKPNCSDVEEHFFTHVETRTRSELILVERSLWENQCKKNIWYCEIASIFVSYASFSNVCLITAVHAGGNLSQLWVVAFTWIQYVFFSSVWLWDVQGMFFTGLLQQSFEPNKRTRSLGQWSLWSIKVLQLYNKIFRFGCF